MFDNKKKKNTIDKFRDETIIVHEENPYAKYKRKLGKKKKIKSIKLNKEEG